LPRFENRGIHHAMEGVTSVRHLRVATFTASEVEQITGVSAAMQRDWRRRGLLDALPGRGWKRLGTDEVIQVLVMRVVSERRISPALARTVGRMAAGAMIDRLYLEAFPGTSAQIELTPTDEGADEKTERHRTRFTKVGPEKGDSVVRYVVHAQRLDSAGRQETSHVAAVRSIEEFRNRADDRFIAFLVVDLSDLFDEMIDRRIKPYFVEVDR
jgi:hypothetical protein